MISFIVGQLVAAAAIAVLEHFLPGSYARAIVAVVKFVKGFRS